MTSQEANPHNAGTVSSGLGLPRLTREGLAITTFPDANLGSLDPDADTASGRLWMGGVSNSELRRSGGPLVLDRGEGIYLWDAAGNRYIDAIASLEAVAVGHGRFEIPAAIQRQYARLEFLDTLRYTSTPVLQLAATLGRLTPGDLQAVHFACSGSEAVETAMKMARQYHVLRKHPSKIKVLSRQGAYHGCTFGTMAIDGGYYRTRTSVFEPLPGVRHLLDPIDTLGDVARALDHDGADQISAVLLDPLATASGIYPQPDSFWLALRELCDKHDVLLIADEVITGFGRTGRWFASERAGVSPDILTVSKALTSGYFPLSAAIASRRVADVFEDEAFLHGHTFGGHPVAAAAALENLRIIDSEQLVDNAATVGQSLFSELQSLKSSPLVAEVRGEGLLYGVELTCPAGQSAVDIGRTVVSQLHRQGVLTFVLHPGNVLFICPPLIITETECRDLVDRIRQSFDDLLPR